MVIVVETDRGFEPDILGDLYLILTAIGLYLKLTGDCPNIFDGQGVGFSIDFSNDTARLKSFYFYVIILIAGFDGDFITRGRCAIETSLMQRGRSYLDVAILKFVGNRRSSWRSWHLGKRGPDDILGRRCRARRTLNWSLSLNRGARRSLNRSLAWAWTTRIVLVAS